MARNFSKFLFNVGASQDNHDELPASSGDHPTPSATLPTRMSVLGSVKLPFRRLDTGDPAYPSKTPLLTLKLSSHSFLSSTLKDDESSSPLYTIRTSGMTTNVIRTHPWREEFRLACIKWPKVVPLKGKGKNVTDGILLQLMGSRWRGGDAVLKPSTSKSGSRKFEIPNYPHNMKWQKHGTVYWCTTSPVKGPIAVFTPTVDNLPPQLAVYETMHDEYDITPLEVYHGVSVLLLDYLLVTAILLVTDIQEWMVVQSPTHSRTSINDDRNSTAALQWRKIVYGEPLYPKLSPSISQLTTLGNSEVNLHSHASEGRVPKRINSETLHSRPHDVSSPTASFWSDSDSEEDGYQQFPIVRQPEPLSPAAESLHPPLSGPAVNAPSHDYFDPMFYSDQEIPPVPPLPSQYTSQRRSVSPISTRSARSNNSKAVRELPVPPSLLSQAWAARSHSSASVSPPETRRRFTESEGLSRSDDSLARLASRRRSSISRPLPHPPHGSASRTHYSADPGIRRARSHARIDELSGERSVPERPSFSPAPLSPTSDSSHSQLSRAPSVLQTPRAPRTLPPTPFDLAIGRVGDGVEMLGVGVDQSQGGGRKSLDVDESQDPRWVRVLGGDLHDSPSVERASYENPPPAYSSIDMQSGRIVHRPDP